MDRSRKPTLIPPKEFKSAIVRPADAANTVAIEWFRKNKNRMIRVASPHSYVEGVLEKWDIYNVVVKKRNGEQMLIKQGAHMTFSAIEGE